MLPSSYQIGDAVSIEASVIGVMFSGPKVLYEILLPGANGPMLVPSEVLPEKKKLKLV